MSQDFTFKDVCMCVSFLRLVGEGQRHRTKAGEGGPMLWKQRLHGVPNATTTSDQGNTTRI